MRRQPDAEASEHHVRQDSNKIGIVQADDEMEAMLQAAATRGVRTMVVRAGDFFGPRAPSSWLGGVMLAKGAPLTSVVTPEVPGALHSWAYLPDLGETIALLADRQALLPAHARFHFAGHPLAGRAMAAAIQRASGGALPVRSFRWLPVYLATPFVTFCREVIEMRYLWPSSLQLDNAALVALLGHEPHTDLDAAVTTTSVALRAKYAADARRPATAGTRVVQPRPRPSQT